MRLTLKTKIWLTVLSIVLMSTFFTLFYFPYRQGRSSLHNYNTEVQNLANMVALAVKISITEENFGGIKTAMEFVKDDPRLKLVSMLRHDTVWKDDHSGYTIKTSVFKTFPENEKADPLLDSNDSLIVKRALFNTSMMSGTILLAFNTNQITAGKKHTRNISLIVSAAVLLFGIFIGLSLARNISVPVLALRDAAVGVGNGDLSQRVKRSGNDEIAELGTAFNKMTNDLFQTRKELGDINISLSESNTALNTTLEELKATQLQLIQSEKMASLGQLTAGIAHEIQNPLNFVNNFSDVSIELIGEMKEDLANGKNEEAMRLADGLDENLKKIIHHGKRADAIVKNMLQHSGKSRGIKEPTDINTLADEYLRLSYHGLRAKDKSFNAMFKTELDESLDKINIIPQDIARVILNLFTNAFYSVSAKKKIAGESYSPVVTLTTKKVGSSAEVHIRDNGMGVPQDLLDKIFLPFFTTKPTGDGTGLGLSLSYDIIKSHNGQLKLETEEGEFAVFIISLPLNG